MGFLVSFISFLTLHSLHILSNCLLKQFTFYTLFHPVQNVFFVASMYTRLWATGYKATGTLNEGTGTVENEWHLMACRTPPSQKTQ